MGEEGVNYATVRLKKKPQWELGGVCKLRAFLRVCVFTVMQHKDSKVVTPQSENKPGCSILNKEPSRI